MNCNLRMKAQPLPYMLNLPEPSPPPARHTVTSLNSGRRARVHSSSRDSGAKVSKLKVQTNC